VNTVLRTLFVWLLLLALPLQGVAAARMLPSAGMPQATAPAAAPASAPAPVKHCHDMQQAAAGDHHPDTLQDKHHGACADCCIVVAPVPAPFIPPACAPPSWAIPFRAAHVPSVAPALPERPPRLLVA
jgi:hypothetical protein